MSRCKSALPFATTAFCFVAVWASLGKAQDALQSEKQQGTGVSTKRWLLLCCGLAGDQPHLDRLSEACHKIVANSQQKLGIEPSRLKVLVSDETIVSKLIHAVPSVDRCNAENMHREFKWLANNASPLDEVWVICLGHAHLYGNKSQFNILGPDIDQVEFAELAKQLKAERQVFMLTMPVTGFWIKPLARANRVVISATEPAAELTGTEMPYALADVLAGQATHQQLEDLDADGIVSVFDLYIAVNLEIEGRFREMEQLQTEHAQLDDNGDGKGNELQLPYLPIISQEDKSASKPPQPRRIDSTSLDGYFARHIQLPVKTLKTP